MYTEEIIIDRELIAKHKDKNETIYFNSKFNFLNQHNGIRPNKMHLLIAPTHVGKSTLVHSIIDSTVVDNNNISVMLYLTEETTDDYISAISHFVDGDEIKGKIRCMVEDKTETDESIKKAITQAIDMHKPKIFFIDNVTTCKLYQDRGTEKQSETAMWLKSLLKKTTLFIVAHTNGNDYNKEMLNENHIRGSKTITNITEFMYVLQPIKLNNTLYQYLRIIKHRGQSMRDNFFLLIWDGKSRTMSGDMPKNFDDFKELFSVRNKL